MKTWRKKTEEFFVKIKKELKSKEFWLSVSISISMVIGLYFKDQSPLSILLALPLVMLILSALPLIAAVSFSVDIAVLFVKLHKKYHKIYSIILKINNKPTYTIRKEFEKDTSQKNFIFFNTWYSLGIIFLVLDTFGIDKMQQPAIVFVVMLGLILPSIIISSALNISIYLMKKRSIMFENNDGTRMSLGSQLGNMVNSFMSPIQIISISYVFTQSISGISFIVSLVLSLIICLSASWFSFYFLKRKQITKLMDKFAQKLQDHQIISN